MTGRSALPGCCRWRCSSARLNHVCFMFLLLCLPLPLRFLDPTLQPFLRRLLFPRSEPASDAFFLSPASIECIFIQFFFFLVSDGSSDPSPPVSPPRARKGEYSSRPHYKAHNVITDSISWYMYMRDALLQFISSLSKFIILSLHIFNVKKKFLSKLLLQPSYLIFLQFVLRVYFYFIFN